MTIIITLALSSLSASAQSYDAPPTIKSIFYTQGDVILFSYHNNSDFVIRNSMGSIAWNGTLNESESKRLTLGAGVYSVAASESYTAIVGASLEQTVVGYFALDTLGKGTSTNFYTFIPSPDPLYSGSKFIIFSYTNSTVVKITDVHNQTVLWQGTLNENQHFTQELSNASWQNITVNIGSNYPVSALCYLDQGFTVPSSTGLFTGTLFNTYAGNITHGNNDLNLIGYVNNTLVTVKNAGSKALIWSGIISEGEIHSEVISQQTYLTISSNQSVAVTVDPYLTWPMMYQASLYATAQDGSLIGKNFFTTARQWGTLRIVAYQDSTHVTIRDQITRALIWDGILNEMGLYTKSTSNTTYNIISDKPVSVEEGYGEWSAMFAPLSFTVDSQPPTGSIKINNGDDFTNSASVILSLTYQDSGLGVSQVRYSNDGVWDTEIWETPSPAKSFTLTSGEGTKTVYYQIKDNVDLISATYADTIVLDTTPPQGSIQINAGANYTNTTVVNLNLFANDAGSGVSQMRFQNESGAWSNWETYTTSKTQNLQPGDGDKTIYVQFRDRAGLSVTAFDTITLDTILPIANAGPNQTAQVGQTLMFNGSGSSDNIGIASYLWDFGDGSTGTGAMPLHSYSNVGSYAVSLSVKDFAGNNAVSSSKITVEVIIPEFSPLIMLFIILALTGVAAATETRRKRKDSGLLC